MRPIPLVLREQLNNDEFMKQCIYENCKNKPEWEHAFIYAGKQINERFAIVPVCTFHHRGRGLNKSFNQFMALKNLFESDAAYISEQLKKYPKKDWQQLKKYLTSLYVR